VSTGAGGPEAPAVVGAVAAAAAAAGLLPRDVACDGAALRPPIPLPRPRPAPPRPVVVPILRITEVGMNARDTLTLGSADVDALVGGLRACACVQQG
jgi:hypothetical protein